ncbi:MAG: efflux RND transporter periplasmic adaptor subunit [Candidatus Aminicenantes bacterium]|nr:MAG: efflux RND transporter periplasmic adaptor subunit [Candidatus Aminicenantes bacterium]
MNNKKKLLVLGLGLFFLAGAFSVSCKKDEKSADEMEMAAQIKPGEKEILYYTCGMHPSVRVTPEDYERGDNSCPLCNMDLVPVFKDQAGMEMGTGEHEGHEEGEVLVKLSARAQSLAQVKVEEVQFRHLSKEILTVGQIDYDERKMAFVAAWIPGRIDKLFVDYTGLTVKKGAPLVSLYSPDLLTTQEEYLLALETLEKVKNSGNQDTLRGAESLVDASKKRLLLWGIQENQVKELESRKTASTYMTIYAPIGGTVIDKNALEGKYVKQGENLYQIAELSNLWLLADIYESDLSSIHKGQTVEITSVAYPGENFMGKIAFIDPFLDPKTRTVKIRVDVPNSELKLKPGMYVDVSISAPIHDGIQSEAKVVYTCPMHPEIITDKPDDCPICGMDLVEKAQAPVGTVLSVPKEAVLNTGTRTLVYVEKEKGIYTPKEVTVGVEAMAVINGQKRRFFAVMSGLTDGVRVVSQANFLIDSQSQITGQAEAIYSGAIDAEGEEKPPSKHIH